LKIDKKLRFVLRALQYKNYRLFFIGQCISLVGTWIQNIAVSWLVYRITHSPFALGLVGFASQIPTFLFTPFAGVFVDRCNKRKLLVITQVLAMVQAFTLGIVVLLNAAAMWQIVFLSVLLGIINALDMPARHAFVYELVDKKEDISNAIALHSSIFNGSRLVGPLIAGVLLSFVNEGVCFLINGISFFAVILALLSIKIKEGVPRKEAKAVLEEFKKGFAYAFSSGPIRNILILVSTVSLMGISYAVLMPVFAANIFSGGPKTLGFLMSQAGLGALIGAVYLASRKSVVGLCGDIAVSTAIIGIGLILFSMSRAIWLSAFLLIITGFGVMVQSAGSSTILQMIADDDKRGRLLSIFITSFIGVMPFGALLAGAMADRIGAPNTVMIGGIVCLFVAIFFARQLKAFRNVIHPIYVKKGIMAEI